MKSYEQAKPDIASPKYTKSVIEKHGFSLKKSLGQNFLIDRNILSKIISAAELTKEKGALEIGPGIGALTEQLASSSKQVVAVEIDQRLIPILKETLQAYSNVGIMNEDILKMDLQALFANAFHECESVSVVANLPYYITTPIIMKFLESRLPLENIVIMIQKEVAERMAAKPGGKEYGSLSIAVQYYSEAEWVTVVPHTVFIPQPHVDSAVIKLKLRKEPAVHTDDETFFFEVVKASFAQRRKTICNNLLNKFKLLNREQMENILRQCDIEPTRRAETLSMNEYAMLSNVLFKYL